VLRGSKQRKPEGDSPAETQFDLRLCGGPLAQPICRCSRAIPAPLEGNLWPVDAVRQSCELPLKSEAAENALTRSLTLAHSSSP
jgi:hypothetical protein